MPTHQDTDLADGDDGYISSDSDFYGDTTLRGHLHRTALAFKPSPKHYPARTLTSSLPNPNALALKNIAMAAVPPRKPYNPHEGDASAYQLSERIDEFLHRLPPSCTLRSIYGDWLWICNPQAPKPPCRDLAHLKKVGEQILGDFERKRDEIEVDMAAKAQSTRTRVVNPLRAGVVERLLALAKESHETSGKWMLFPSASDVDRIWGIVARGVLEGRLGVGAKVATCDDVGVEGAGGRYGNGGDRTRLICVYTADFSNKKDVKRVLEGLKKLGLVGRKGAYGQEVGVWYKCDAFTHLGIDGSNPWGLKPSLYSSKEALAWDLSIDQDGDIEMGDGSG